MFPHDHGLSGEYKANMKSIIQIQSHSLDAVVILISEQHNKHDGRQGRRDRHNGWNGMEDIPDDQDRRFAMFSNCFLGKGPATKSDINFWIENDHPPLETFPKTFPKIHPIC